MKVQEIIEVLEAKAFTDLTSAEVKTACASDLMSDVLAFSKSSTVLLTGLINPQVIRTAEMMDIVCVVFVRDKTPSDDIINLAKEIGITVLSTKYTMYYAAGRLYDSGLF